MKKERMKKETVYYCKKCRLIQAQPKLQKKETIENKIIQNFNARIQNLTLLISLDTLQLKTNC